MKFLLNKIKVEELYVKGYTYEEIANTLDSNVATVRKCISRNFRQLAEEQDNAKLNKAEELYIKGYTSKEIGKELGLNDSTIRNYVSDKFKHLKDQHDFKNKERKKLKREINRLLTKENNQYMSTQQVVKQNLQSYKNIDGKLIFDAKNRGARPFDLPRTYEFQA